MFSEVGSIKYTAGTSGNGDLSWDNNLASILFNAAVWKSQHQKYLHVNCHAIFPKIINAHNRRNDILTELVKN